MKKLFGQLSSISVILIILSLLFVACSAQSPLSSEHSVTTNSDQISDTGESLPPEINTKFESDYDGNDE